MNKGVANGNNNNSSRKIRLEHVISFSDAIFAFSITFMAISIQIPNLPLNHITEQQFISKLLQLLPQFELCGKFYDCGYLLDFIPSCV